MSYEERLKALDDRLKRSHNHLLTVLATQRERTDKAFDEVRLSLLEQEAAARLFRERTERAFDQMKIAFLEQETSFRTHFGDLQQALGELIDCTKAQGDQLSDHEERLRRLERGQPPAA